MPDDDLLPIRKQDLHVGEAVRYPIYDRQHHLLIAAGDVIQNEKQVDTLINIGFFINPQWQAPRTPTASGGARVHRAGPAEIEPAAHATAPASRERAQQPSAAKNLPQTKLQPGTVVYLQSVGDALKPKAAVKLIGWVDKTAVLVSAVGANGSVLPFRDDEVLQFKTIAGKDIISFFARVLKMSFVPYPHLHLAWPDQLQIHQLRKSLRVNTRLIVSISNLTQPNYPANSARLVNLSAGGAMLESAELLGAKDDELQLGIRIPAAGETHTLSVKAIIRNIHDGEISQDAHSWGLEFAELPMAERLILEHYIYQMLLEN